MCVCVCVCAEVGSGGGRDLDLLATDNLQGVHKHSPALIKADDSVSGGLQHLVAYLGCRRELVLWLHVAKEDLQEQGASEVGGFSGRCMREVRTWRKHTVHGNMAAMQSTAHLALAPISFRGQEV